jgi:hypothetical protein
MTPEEQRQIDLAEIERLREENRRLIASEAALLTRQRIYGRIIGDLARKTRADLERIAARH